MGDILSENREANKRSINIEIIVGYNLLGDKRKVEYKFLESII